MSNCLKSLKSICFELIHKNLHEMYLLCLNRSLKIPQLLAQQIYDNMKQFNSMGEDYLFFSKEICSLSKIEFTSVFYIHLVYPEMRIDTETIVEVYFSTRLLLKELMAIVENIHHFKNLQSFNLEHRFDMAEDFEILCKNLGKIAENLKKLNFNGCRLKDNQVDPFLNLLEKCYNLETLFLFNNKRVFTEKFFQILKNKRKLLNLNFDSNFENIPCNNFSQELAKFIYKNPHILYLDLTFNSNLKTFFLELEELNKYESREFCMEKLNLFSMEIPRNESSNLANFLKRCQHLKYLDLSENRNLEFSEIFKNLNVCKNSLKVLDINNCNLSEEDFKHFLNLLPQLNRIMYICCNNNNVSIDHLNNLHKIVKELKAIKRVQLPNLMEIDYWMEDANKDFEQHHKYITNYPFNWEKMLESLN